MHQPHHQALGMLRLGASEDTVPVAELLPEFANKFGEVQVQVAGQSRRVLNVKFTGVEQNGREFRVYFAERDAEGNEQPSREIRIADEAARALRLDTCSVVQAGDITLILPSPNYLKVG